MDYVQIRERETNAWSTCCKLGGGDAKGLDLQSERVEREGRSHHQNLLCLTHVGATQCAPQVVQVVVTGRERS